LTDCIPGGDIPTGEVSTEGGSSTRCDGETLKSTEYLWWFTVTETDIKLHDFITLD
jgi:hypothetical protein